MIVPCEVASKSVVPALKALLAKGLMEKRGLRQDQVAAILGISQSAVSKYTNEVRGRAIEIQNLREIETFVDAMIGLLVDESGCRSELLSVFCQTCAAVRKTSLMCGFCRKADSKIDRRNCSFCLVIGTSKSKR